MTHSFLKAIPIIFILELSQIMCLSQEKDKRYDYYISYHLKAPYSPDLQNITIENFPSYDLYENWNYLSINILEKSVAQFFKDSVFVYTLNKNKSTFIENESKETLVPFIDKSDRFGQWEEQPSLFYLRKYSYPLTVDTFITSFTLGNSDFGNVSIMSNYPLNIDLYKTRGESIKISDFKAKSNFNFHEIDIEKMEFSSLVLPSIDWQEARVKELTIAKTTIDTSVSFDGLKLPNSIFLNNINVTSEGLIDLSNFTIDSNALVCDLYLDKLNFSKIKVNYMNFKLCFPLDSFGKELTNNDKKENIYTGLLESQKKEGFSLGYEKLDKEYNSWKINRDYGPFINWLNEWWWDYGYSKIRIIQRIAQIFGLFLLLNFYFYPFLRTAYKVDSIDKAYLAILKRNWFLLYKLLAYIYLTFLFTNYLFWGIKLDFQKIKIKPVVWSCLIFIQHAVGLACLAWLAGIIIIR